MHSLTSEQIRNKAFTNINIKIHHTESYKAAKVGFTLWRVYLSKQRASQQKEKR